MYMFLDLLSLESFINPSYLVYCRFPQTSVIMQIGCSADVGNACIWWRLLWFSDTWLACLWAPLKLKKKNRFVWLSLRWLTFDLFSCWSIASDWKLRYSGSCDGFFVHVFFIWVYSFTSSKSSWSKFNLMIFSVFCCFCVHISNLSLIILYFFSFDFFFMYFPNILLDRV